MSYEQEFTETQAQGDLPPIRVLTYNIKGGEGAVNRWHGRERDFLDLDSVTALIREHSPDVVSLQEIAVIGSQGQVANQVALLADSLGMAHAFAPVEGSNLSEQGRYAGHDFWGNAVLSRFPIVDHRTYELCSGRPKECRSLLETRLLVGTQVLTFAAVHLSYIWRTTFAQARELVSLLSLNSAPVILAGDFNASAGSAELSPLHSAFTDAFSLAGLSYGDPRRYSFPSGPAAKRDLDHVFVSPGVRVRSCRVLVDQEGISDHNPLLVEVCLPAARGAAPARSTEMVDDLTA
ncbi:MAG: endonuclease/exonuclease/phosphatase family protein [Chloroflexota bacterium]